MSSISREVSTKNQKEMLKMTLTEMKSAFDRLIKRGARLRKESVNPLICQQKFPKLKCKEKDKPISKNCGAITKGVEHT